MGLLSSVVRCLAGPFRCFASTGTGGRASRRDDDDQGWKDCHDYAGTLYPDATEIKPVEHQGACSYTLLVSQHSTEEKNQQQGLILQFRPVRYALDHDIARRAREVYGELAPVTSSRGRLRRKGPHMSCQVLEMSLVPGIRLSETLPKTKVLADRDLASLHTLLEGLASFLLAGVTAAATSTERRRRRGKIGSSILPRLQKLARELPTAFLRMKADDSLKAVQGGALERLPVVLTHGDLLPSNVMVDRATWKLNGLVDWAESEDLPFGVALYGVEHLLGCLEEGQGGKERWVWYEQAKELRRSFELKLREGLSSAIKEADVKVARDVGVLLWHGYAWDDGQIDRVVNEEDDALELAYLRALLEDRSSPQR